MDKWIIILFICIVLFLLSYCLLYRKRVSNFFKLVGGGIKSFFGLFKGKKKAKVTKEQKKNRATKSELQSRPVLLLPKATKEDKKEKQSEKEQPTPTKETQQKNAQDIIKTGGKFVASSEKLLSEQQFEEKKQAMKDDFDKFLDELEEQDNADDLEDYFDEDNESDDDKLESEFKDRVKKNNSVNVDGENVDLSKLPPKIRRLLLSGMLDRKGDE